MESNAYKMVGACFDGSTEAGVLLLLEYPPQPELARRVLLPWQLLQTQSAMSIAGLVAETWHKDCPELASQAELFDLALVMMVANLLTPEGQEMKFTNTPVMPSSTPADSAS